MWRTRLAARGDKALGTLFSLFFLRRRFRHENIYEERVKAAQKLVCFIAMATESRSIEMRSWMRTKDASLNKLRCLRTKSSSCCKRVCLALRQHDKWLSTDLDFGAKMSLHVTLNESATCFGPFRSRAQPSGNKILIWSTSFMRLGARLVIESNYFRILLGSISPFFQGKLISVYNENKKNEAEKVESELGRENLISILELFNLNS